jgi:hypothetical protein
LFYCSRLSFISLPEQAVKPKDFSFMHLLDKTNYKIVTKVCPNRKVCIILPFKNVALAIVRSVS